jgi:hypothetical protein
MQLTTVGTPVLLMREAAVSTMAAERAATAIHKTCKRLHARNAMMRILKVKVKVTTELS